MSLSLKLFENIKSYSLEEMFDGTTMKPQIKQTFKSFDSSIKAIGPLISKGKVLKIVIYWNPFNPKLEEQLNSLYSFLEHRHVFPRLILEQYKN